MSKPLPTPEMLRKLLRYDQDTGNMYWLERTPDMFTDGKQSAVHRCRICNSKFSGTEALTTGDGNGYLQGQIFGTMYKSHRVVWAIVHGEWPAGQIDHINGIRDDNRIENLRSVSAQENSRNKKIPSDNTSGVMGVSWSKRYKKWESYIMADGKSKNLGYFYTKEDAVTARSEAEIKYGFHQNHGRK